MSKRLSPILDGSGKPHVVEATARGAGGYESHPPWLAGRHWEAAETNRLNQAHWAWAQGTGINQWLDEHLETLRTRATYESRQNPTLAGVIRTHADDIVGQDGPIFQVYSDDEDYNEALEQLWRDWWAAPTMRPNVSGAALLKLWIVDLWRCGEILCRIATDPAGEGPVKMRLWPAHPRRLATPTDATGDPNSVLGIRFDRFGRPATYWIADAAINGQAALSLQSQPWPADLIVHEFTLDEEDQARGFPWATTALNAASELRDYDDQVLDAARQSADTAALLYTEHPDAPYYGMPDSTTVQRRQISMAPPGWKPWRYQANSPPVQYVDYRAERQRELGRQVGMPLATIRLDASNHNYASMRWDGQAYDRSNESIQIWLSGSEKSCGTLNRLADLLAQEARFTVPALRTRPATVRYEWTWPKREHVDPAKSGLGEAIGLQNLTLSLGDALAGRGKTLALQVPKIKRELKLLEGLPAPGAWINNPNAVLAMLAGEETDQSEQPVTAEGSDG